MPTSSRKVLVIDDDSTQQVLAKDYLSSAGFAVRVAEDGAKGKKFASTFNPDVILLDLILPSSSGYDLCRELKQDPQTAEIPVILITGSRQPDVIQRGLEAGAADFVTKPLDWEFLADRVSHVLNQKAGEAEVSEAGPKAEVPAREQVSDHSVELAAIKSENSELKGAVQAATRKIAELSSELEARPVEAQAPTAPSVAEFHAQVSQIEKEWSDRLQQALAQASQRADQRIAEIQGQLDSKVNEVAALQETQKRLQAAAASEAETTLAEKTQEFAATMREKLDAAAEAHSAEVSRITQSHRENVDRIWKFVASATDEYRTALRRQQAIVGELMQGIEPGKGTESVFDQVDTLTTVMVGNLRNFSQLNELARIASERDSVGEEQNVRLSSLIEQSVNHVKIRQNRHDITVSDVSDPLLEITTNPFKFKSALAHLLDHVMRHTQPAGTVQVETETDQDGTAVLKIVNLGSGIGLQRESDEKLSSDTEALPGDGDIANLGLWLGKSVFTQLGARMSINGVPGLGTTISVSLPQQSAAALPESQDGAALAEAV